MSSRGRGDVYHHLLPLQGLSRQHAAAERHSGHSSHRSMPAREEKDEVKVKLKAEKPHAKARNDKLCHLASSS